MMMIIDCMIVFYLSFLFVLVMVVIFQLLAHEILGYFVSGCALPFLDFSVIFIPPNQSLLPLTKQQHCCCFTNTMTRSSLSVYWQSFTRH